MSTHEHEMFRQALRSVADSIEPRPDGLGQIRARLRRRPYSLPVAWAVAAWMRLMLWLPDSAFSAGRRAYSARGQVVGKLRSASQRPVPASGQLRSISEWFLSDLPEPVAANARDGKLSTWSLLRPLATFGVAVFIVAVGAYVAFEVPALVSTQNNQTTHNGNGNGGPTNGSLPLGHGSSSPSASSGFGRSPALPSPSSSCLPTLGLLGPSGGASPSRSRSTSPSATASPTPTGSGSPSSTSSPSPTPTRTGSSTPTASGTPSSLAGASHAATGASAGAARATADTLILPAKAAAASTRNGKSSCGSPRPSNTKKAGKRRPGAPPIAGIGRLFTTAKPARHQSSTSA